MARKKKEIVKQESSVSMGEILSTDLGLHPHSPEAYKQFKEIEAERYKDLTFTPNEARLLKLSMSRMSTGVFSVLPLTCMQERCPLAKECPLLEMGKAPLYKKCPLELNMIEELYHRYTAEFKVQPGDFAQLALIDDLITTEILLKRTLNAISDPSLRENFYKKTLGLEESEFPIKDFQDGTITVMNDLEFGRQYDIRVHPALEQMERLSNKKIKILTALVGTPQERYKRDAALKQHSGEDMSKTLTTVREALNKILDTVQIDDITRKYLDSH